MRLRDRLPTGPHRVAILEGGHTWLSSELATEAVEWMEIQAMKSGRRERDAVLIDKLFARRAAQPAAQTSDKHTARALAALLADFGGGKSGCEVPRGEAECGRGQSASV